MSEHLNRKFEMVSGPETHQQSRELMALLENEARQSKEDHPGMIEKARDVIEKSAVSKEKTKVDNQESNPNNQSHHYLTKSLKSKQYFKTMESVRQNLRPKEIIASRVIHNSAVESISELSSKTIARPTSVITGSLVALICGVATIVIAKKVGFSLPYSVIIIFYIAGYLVGLLIELVKTLVLKSRQKT